MGAFLKMQLPTNQSEDQGPVQISIRVRYWTILLSSIVAATSCTNRDAYELIRQNRLQACEELPIPQQASCKENYQIEYEEYRRSLQVLDG